MTSKAELEQRIEVLEDWHQKSWNKINAISANIGAIDARLDGMIGVGSKMYTMLEARLIDLERNAGEPERAQSAPAPRYASSETFLEALTEQVAALRKMQAEPTNRQCVAEALLDAALAGYSYEDAAARLLEVSTSLNIYNSQGRTLRAMAGVLERAAKEEAE